jgi:hypothetical protein
MIENAAVPAVVTPAPDLVASVVAVMMVAKVPEVASDIELFVDGGIAQI